jgi:hypothetical protein
MITSATQRHLPKKKKKKKRQETQPKETAITRQQAIMDENSSTGNTGRNTSNTILPTDLTQSLHIEKTFTNITNIFWSSTYG